MSGPGESPGDSQPREQDHDDLRYATALSCLPMMTPQRLRRLLESRRSAEVWAEVLSADARVRALLHEMPSFADGVLRPSGLARRPAQLTVDQVVSEWRRYAGRLDVGALFESITSRGIAVLRHGAPGYPDRLERDDEPPELLFVRGDISVAARASVAIVGTRRATHYGTEVAAELASDLARAGVCVVSGLAAGIDAAAHEGALAALGDEPADGAGRPLGVLGGGVDVYYPSRNRRLIDRVLAAGAVVSEAPPGDHPEPWRFPLRNRIIATLAQVVVVVESGRSGGAMHTVNAAERRGREVFAVPGSIRSPSSEGTNHLLAEGAHPCRDAADVIVAVETSCRAEGLPLPGTARLRPSTGERARAVRLDRATVDRLLRRCGEPARNAYRALEEHPLPLDRLCERTSLTIADVALALDELLECGLAAPAGGGWRRL